MKSDLSSATAGLLRLSVRKSTMSQTLSHTHKSETPPAASLSPPRSLNLSPEFLTLVPFRLLTPLFGSFSLHRSHFLPAPRSAAVPRWFVGVLVCMSSAGPSVCPLRHSKLPEGGNTGTHSVCSHPMKPWTSAVCLRLRLSRSNSPSHKIRTLPVNDFQKKATQTSM